VSRLRGPTSRVIDVAAGLVFRDGKLLITQRHPKDHLGGLWEFPGGKRELGETFEECLIRELREELGIEVAVGELLETLTHDYPTRSIHLRFFRCRLVAGEPQTLGCSALEWIDAGGLAKHEFPAADARLLEKLRNSPGIWK
jgi:8-oxo-dGTP diphosphatase